MLGTDPSPRRRVVEATRALTQHIEAQGPLALVRAGTLEPHELDRLVALGCLSSDKDWLYLVRLCTAAQILSVRNQTLQLDRERADELLDGADERALQVALMCGALDDLALPELLSEVMLSLGVHPSWVIEIGKHQRGVEVPEHKQDGIEQLLDAARDWLLGMLRALRSTYPKQTSRRLLFQVGSILTNVARGELQTALLLDSVRRGDRLEHRIQQSLVDTLLDQVCVPAGVLTSARKQATVEVFDVEVLERVIRTIKPRRQR